MQCDLLREITQPPALVDDAGDIQYAVMQCVGKIQVAGGNQRQQQERCAQLDAHRQAAGWRGGFGLISHGEMPGFRWRRKTSSTRVWQYALVGWHLCSLFF
ncbi:MAG: hypothetical protein A2143_08265 [Gallionellales bacterium RBG_16_57_15]|nr:MAG: hypothetical protein A2143_08265 [Gallionellales bacterium RBG_16_57_15]